MKFNIYINLFFYNWFGRAVSPQRKLPVFSRERLNIWGFAPYPLVRAVSPQAKFRSLRPERLDISEQKYANHLNYDSGAGFLKRFPEFKWLLVLHPQNHSVSNSRHTNRPGITKPEICRRDRTTKYNGIAISV